MSEERTCYIIGKGPSLDEMEMSWFDASSPVWCLNQAADVARAVLPGNEIACIQNDFWIKYAPPADVMWYRHHRVPSDGRQNTEEYDPELLTGRWASPTCLCALELAYRKGYNHFIMVGFDSFFNSNSKAYADCLGVESDQIAPFDRYITLMRRWAAYSHVKLTWLDEDGTPHPDDLEFRKGLVAVAVGEKYVKQTEGMISSFLKYNPGWEVRRFYDADLDDILPKECRKWSAFNKAELGRHIAVKRCLETDCDTVLYCDGDMRWYGQYEISVQHDIVLSRHYITSKAAENAKHWIHKDGVANLGMFEMSRSIDHDRIFDFMCGEVLHNPNAFKHKDQLWLQNLASSLPECGFDAVYSNDPGLNCACWNLRHEDRLVFERDGVPWVKTNTQLKYPLRSFHFSSKSLGSLWKYGPTVQRLLKEYLEE